MKTHLLEEAKAAGWTIVNCSGEADKGIASQPLTDQDVVVSGDSDLLFYENIQHVFRPTHSGFQYYNKPNILDHLGVTSVQWTSIGVVSGNDFAVGDAVLMRLDESHVALKQNDNAKKLRPRWSAPFRVTDVLSDSRYNIANHTKSFDNVHVSHLKHYFVRA